MSKVALFAIICVAVVASETSAHIHTHRVREEKCMLPITRGPCIDYGNRYAYDPIVNKCVKFKYGGCGGNGNNFIYHHECRRACII